MTPAIRFGAAARFDVRTAADQYKTALRFPESKQARAVLAAGVARVEAERGANRNDFGKASP